MGSAAPPKTLVRGCRGCVADTTTAQGRRARGEDVYCPFVQPELSLKEQYMSLGVRDGAGSRRGCSGTSSLLGVPAIRHTPRRWGGEESRETRAFWPPDSSQQGSVRDISWDKQPKPPGRWHAVPGGEHSCWPPAGSPGAGPAAPATALGSWRWAENHPQTPCKYLHFQSFSKYWGTLTKQPCGRCRHAERGPIGFFWAGFQRSSASV